MAQLLATLRQSPRIELLEVDFTRTWSRIRWHGYRGSGSFWEAR